MSEDFKDRRSSVHYLCWDIRGLKAAGNHAALMHDMAITPYRGCVFVWKKLYFLFTVQLTAVFILSIPHVLPAILPLHQCLVPVSVAKIPLGPLYNRPLR